MTMHLDVRLSAINTRKRKLKLTKGKLKELELRWREHNRRCKRNHLHDFRFATLEEYIDYYNNRRIKLRLNGKSPVQYRALLQEI